MTIGIIRKSGDTAYAAGELSRFLKEYTNKEITEGR